MTDTTDARTEVLARVRSALGLREGQDSTGPVDVPRDYRHTGSVTGADLVDLLVDRLDDYNATVARVGGSDAEIAEAVAGFLSRRGHNGASSRIVAPDALSDAWLAGVDAETLRDAASAPVDLDALNSVDAVVTASTVAVADTGTIVLADDADGRRATTLVPDHHVVVVRVADIVELVPEAVSVLTGRGLHTRPVTMVSGPSATVDIELVRVQGVHGPRTLDVVIAG
jgi:L-lactate dehydrogenase complex protein LldG